MSGQKIKICGVNDLSILEEIVNLEIDYVGFIFFELRRKLFINL